MRAGPEKVGVEAKMTTRQNNMTHPPYKGIKFTDPPPFPGSKLHDPPLPKIVYEYYFKSSFCMTDQVSNEI